MALHENFDTPQRPTLPPVESLESRVAKLEADVKALKAAIAPDTAEPAKLESPKAPEKK